MSTDKSRAVYGIDLGTTYSCIAQVDKYDQPVVLTNYEGEQTTPSVVYFENIDRAIVGSEAKGMLATEPFNCVSFVKRSMGNDEAFDKSRNQFPYHLDPSEISALILRKLVQDANLLADRQEPVKDVVITCPAYFGTKERMQTKQAGEIAGLNVIGIINEPTAAAIAYGMKTTDKKTILVYDLGGGTFDVTIINVDNGAIKVIATGGDHHLGGVDWDTEMANYMLDEFNSSVGGDYTMDDEELKYKLLLEAEHKKKMLSAKDVVRCNIQYDGRSARFDISRELFDALTQTHLDETIDATKKVIDIAREKGYDGNIEFILVGGSSRMPQVKRRIDEEFGCDAKINDPDQCVAKGAAIYAMNEAYNKAMQNYENGKSWSKPKKMNGPRARVVNVTSQTYGIGCKCTEIDPDKNFVKNLIFANTPLPAHKEDIFNLVNGGNPGDYLPIRVFEDNFTNPEDEFAEERFCTFLDAKDLTFTKHYEADTDVAVSFNLDEEGILHIFTQIGNDIKEFNLHITGVKTASELSKSIDTIGKTAVE